jgi:hypothetical protein
MQDELKPGDVLTTANFDPDFSPRADINKRAAKVRGLKYDPNTRQYKDADGCPVRDRFGQPL